MDFQLQYFVPKGFPAAPAGFDPKIMELGASLRGADTDQGAIVPGTPLTIRLLLMTNGAGIEFDYAGQLAYINICCFEKKHTKIAFTIVERRYNKYGLGEPKKPSMDRWIYLIPVAGQMPDPDHSILSQQLAVAFYWAAYGQLIDRPGRK